MMKVLGADPDSKPTAWDEGGTRGPVLYRGEVGDLIKYFCYHKRVPWGNVVDERDRAALASSIKRLLRRGYSPTSVRRSMDRFYLTRTSQNHPHPALAFCSKKFQAELFEGETLGAYTVDIGMGNETKLVEREDYVLDFLVAGCVRDENMVLPWDPSFDDELRVEFYDPSLSRLLLTYPDVVALILTGYSDQYKLSTMDVAAHQLEYLLGERSASPLPFRSVQKNLLIPKDFLLPSKVRRTKDTIKEAVNASGR